MDMQKKPLGLSRIYIILCWVCEVVVLDFVIGCCFVLNTYDTFGLPHHRKKIRGAPNSQIFGAIHKPLSADLALSTKGLGNLKAFSIGWYMSLFFLFCPAPERDLGNAGMGQFPCPPRREGRGEGIAAGAEACKPDISRSQVRNSRGFSVIFLYVTIYILLIITVCMFYMRPKSPESFDIKSKPNIRWLNNLVDLSQCILI